jgi:hypothetical protein
MHRGMTSPLLRKIKPQNGDMKSFFINKLNEKDSSLDMKN